MPNTLCDPNNLVKQVRRATYPPIYYHWDQGNSKVREFGIFILISLLLTLAYHVHFKEKEYNTRNWLQTSWKGWRSKQERSSTRREWRVLLWPQLLEGAEKNEPGKGRDVLSVWWEVSVPNHHPNIWFLKETQYPHLVTLNPASLLIFVLE